MIGKVPQSLLADLVLDRTGTHDERVVQGPAYGEDTGAIQLEDGILVVSTDPISLAAERVGTLGVAIACNDVAASGATPEWLTVSIFLHDDDPDLLDTLTAQLDAAATAMDVAIVSGHSEYAPAMDRPMLVLTAFGLTDRYVPTGGATPGDAILLTKGAATEATAILAADFGDELAVDPVVIEDGLTYYDRLSVTDEATLLGPDATAMHDPTEGGLHNGLVELATASGVALDVDREAISVTSTTGTLCEAAGVDPLRVFGSGALLATLPEGVLDVATDRLRGAGIDHAIIGTVEAADTPAVHLDGETIVSPIEDEMYALWA